MYRTLPRQKYGSRRPDPLDDVREDGQPGGQGELVELGGLFTPPTEDLLMGRPHRFAQNRQLNDQMNSYTGDMWKYAISGALLGALLGVVGFIVNIGNPFWGFLALFFEPSWIIWALLGVFLGAFIGMMFSYRRWDIRAGISMMPFYIW